MKNVYESLVAFTDVDGDELTVSARLGYDAATASGFAEVIVATTRNLRLVSEDDVTGYLSAHDREVRAAAKAAGLLPE